MRKEIEKVTQRIIERSRERHSLYLQHCEQMRKEGPFRHHLPCSNFAHDLAVCSPAENTRMRGRTSPNIAIISSYNDMLSAHQPYGNYPAVIKEAVLAAGGTAQVASGVPAMCDGVTQGMPGMDLSLISRDVIAQATVIGLSHNVFDGCLLLGICDKIMPGLLMGALQFGHLPMALVPGGPMTSGLPNKEKAHARELYAEGKISRDEMLDHECRAYHGAGTCTFYGTANSNQLLAELLGMHLPGASFVNSETRLRHALTRKAAVEVTSRTDSGDHYTPISQVISEKSIVNAMVGLLATGGSTNETMHLVAIARAAGIRINWDDFSELSAAVPLIARIYPNGPADINEFQKAGGMALLIKELLDGGFLHEDVQTVAGPGLEQYTRVPALDNGEVVWSQGPSRPLNPEVITTVAEPFADQGGIKVLSGNLGRAIMKVSALADGIDTFVEAPALVFNHQYELEEAFRAGKLNRDLVAVVRFQGPRANGMPELHKLITYLGVVMGRGYQAGLVTDGRLSGASGKVPFAIHVTPEALCGGLLAKIEDGDIIRMDARNGSLALLVDNETLAKREFAQPDLKSQRYGFGRQIFAPLRRDLSGAEEGATSIFTYVNESTQVTLPQE